MDSTRCSDQLEAFPASSFQPGGVFVRCLPRATCIPQHGIVSSRERGGVGKIDKPKLGKSHVSGIKARYKPLEAHCGSSASEHVLSRLPNEVRDAEADAKHIQAGQLHVLVRPSGWLLCPGDHLQRQGLFHCQREGATLAPRRFTHGMERISVPILHSDAPDGTMAALPRTCGKQRLTPASPSRLPQSAGYALERTTGVTLCGRFPMCDVLSLGGSDSAKRCGLALNTVGSGPQPQERDVGARSGDCASGYGDRPRTWCLPRPSREAAGHTRPSTSDLGYRWTKPALDTSKDARLVGGKSSVSLLGIPSSTLLSTRAAQCSTHKVVLGSTGQVDQPTSPRPALVARRPGTTEQSPDFQAIRNGVSACRQFGLRLGSSVERSQNCPLVLVRRGSGPTHHIHGVETGSLRNRIISPGGDG